MAEWQSRRLQHTHRDLAADRRYRPAARFFLTDLYGPHDLTRRDDDMQRAFPFLGRTLPDNVLHSLGLALEQLALSRELDVALAGVLFGELGATTFIDAQTYAEAYRRCDNYELRVRQIELVSEIGEALDAVVARPWMSVIVRLARRPAHLAGFGALHDFLEAGFESFRHMGGAEEFLHRIVTRERHILDSIYGGEPVSDWAPPAAPSETAADKLS